MARSRRNNIQPRHKTPTQFETIKENGVHHSDGDRLSTTRALLLENFHTKVTELFDKAKEPCMPQNYRGQNFPSSDEYILLHEEEQHLADNFAFLAQTQEGANFVSAVTLEYSPKGQSSIIRLAMNKTPSVQVVNGLEALLETVKEGSMIGGNQEEYRCKILDRVVELSTPRLYSRINSLKAKKTKARHSQRKTPRPPLRTRIEKLKMSLLASRTIQSAGLRPLCDKLSLLVRAIENVDKDSSNQAELLKVVLRRSFEISTMDSNKSLETHLKSFGLNQDIYEDRAVFDIDKVGKYLEICNYLVDISRTPKYQPLFHNMRLKTLTSPARVHPPGSRMQCCVHGEVLLVLFHDQNETHPPPRAIGSSKSACFLCDLFITKHGRFRISRAHNRLYEQWTFPETNWMTEKQANQFYQIVREMNLELQRFIDNHPGHRPGYRGNGPESRLHLLLLPSDALLASPIRSTVSLVEKANPSIPSTTLLCNNNPANTGDLGGGGVSVGTARRFTYGLEHLPIMLEIHHYTMSCIFTAGISAEYEFDLEDVEAGELHISDGVGVEPCLEAIRVNARGAGLDSPMCIQTEPDSQTLTFGLHDAEQYGLRITIVWKDP